MSTGRPRLVGINHVALEVGELDAALQFYRSIFGLRGVKREPGMAFIDMGDQFLALSQGRSQPPDQARHFGLVVDDKSAARGALERQQVAILPGRRLDFLDPWATKFR
jgi:lactoylglutathione lyase